jgi:hypothetical protein
VEPSAPRPTARRLCAIARPRVHTPRGESADPPCSWCLPTRPTSALPPRSPLSASEDRGWHTAGSASWCGKAPSKVRQGLRGSRPRAARRGAWGAEGRAVRSWAGAAVARRPIGRLVRGQVAHHPRRSRSNFGVPGRRSVASSAARLGSWPRASTRESGWGAARRASSAWARGAASATSSTFRAECRCGCAPRIEVLSSRRGAPDATWWRASCGRGGRRAA